MKKRNNGNNNKELDVPEIPHNAKLKPLHRRPPKGAKLPQEQVKLRLEKHILTWFRYEAERQNREVNSFINEALRQFIIRRVGDPEFQTGGLNPIQRAEVEALIGERLATPRKPRR
ncbi:MAG: BrnA antitoxin family protein [candidate division KSB1 bacterium]|nr:BrnA antitoxin family protein [candidate division KSB1 bacterium]MDZ7304258.1 BrnA antitoxin family protein [candidate division KSB1 bacterium]MDZ7312874.1 BrnA antitoxin family protein [candidate division KSB1 bacterium]